MKIDFYSEKSNQLPRLIYRNLIKLAASNPSADLRTNAESFIVATKGPDYLKMTWVLPGKFRAIVSPENLSSFSRLVESHKARRPERLKRAVFPHAADEFSLSSEFLNEVFDRNRLCSFSSEDVVYTLGSCFARNFAKYLSSRGLRCQNFGQAEDLNSPGSNQVFLKYASKIDDPELDELMRQELREIWADSSDELIAKIIRSQMTFLRSVRDGIAGATKVIITLGNTVDFYREKDGSEELVPKFLAMPPSEDVRVRDSVFSRLGKNGTYSRLSTFNEVKSHVEALYHHVRAMNQNCRIILTVSPVPIDSVLGLRGLNMFATEVDCVSKSTLRAALHEAMNTHASMKSDPQLHYLPSFEIVRWIAPVTGVATFGAEDGASRHVSNDVLNAVCEFAYQTE
jgi:GTPase SAR1 family protein